jgi:hypothetical protein
MNKIIFPDQKIKKINFFINTVVSPRLSQSRELTRAIVIFTLYKTLLIGLFRLKVDRLTIIKEKTSNQRVLFQFVNNKSLYSCFIACKLNKL